MDELGRTDSLDISNALSEGSISADYAESLAEQRLGPGILLMTPTMQLIHMDRRAWELTGRIIREGNGAVAMGVLPEAVTALCSEIVAALRVRTDAKDWEQVQLRRLAGDPTRPVLLRGFGLPDREGSSQQGRILILMEEVAQRKDTHREEAVKRYRLTPREHVVIRYLAKGLTNKEIANLLDISEPTVKSHIRNIMEKTKTTTRTGILAEILGS